MIYGDVEDKDFRRSQWYQGTDIEKASEAKRRCREWMKIVLPRIKDGHRPVCAEIGVWEGEHAWIMFNVLNPSELILIDPFKDMVKFVGVHSADDDDAYDWVRGIFKNKPEVTVLKSTSVDASKMYPDGYFDYVYIDGIHDYEHAKEDMIAWWPKVSSTGCLCGHDAGYPGVMAALKELGKPGLIISPNGTEWVIPKTT